MSVRRDTPPADPPAPALDVDGTCRFLQIEAGRLHLALDYAEMPEVLGPVLRRHEGSHGRWLHLIAAAHRADDAAADVLELLYSQHGCVVGTLERGLDPLLRNEVRARVRQVLAGELATRTQEALAAVRALDAGSNQG
jgi:hypothetical protein